MVAAMTRKEPKDLSPVFARAERVRPKVEQPDSPWTVPLGLVGAGVLGILVFGALSNGREARAQAPRPVADAPPPPPAPPPGVLTPAPPPAAAPPIGMPTSLPPIVRVNPEEAHWRAPAMVIDLSTGGAPIQLAQATTTAPGGAPPAGAAPEDRGLSADERFAARVSGGGTDAARAYQMRDLARTVPQGAVIPAVLETALDSDLPGAARGLVSRDVKSFDGSRILIPRGSHLIGQYKSGVALGQRRAFVIWSRLVTPNGVSIDIASPAADRLGRGGLDGKVDEHFFQRFGAAILLSVMNAGLEAAASSGNSGAQNNLVIGSTNQANRIAEIALQRQIDIPPTIRVAAGTPVQVFVSRDLDFSAVVR
jgi:type IV secretory pathway VirB10-like protein